jgi:DnaJ family protein C protein 28
MDEFVAEEILAKLDRIAERRIQEGIEAGAFNNLEGEGKPLQIEDNPFVPKDMRAAFKVLENSGYAPDWMTVAQEIDADLATLRRRADDHFAYLRSRLAQVGSDPYAVKRLRLEVERLKSQHRRAATQHSAAIVELNKKIAIFNQMVPIASLFRVPLSLEIEMEKYEDRLPAYLSYV